MYEHPKGLNIFSFTGMNYSTFSYDSFVREHLAVGAMSTSKGFLPAPIGRHFPPLIHVLHLLSIIAPEGWDAPAGGLFSTARDMARLVKYNTFMLCTPNHFLDGLYF